MLNLDTLKTSLRVCDELASAEKNQDYQGLSETHHAADGSTIALASENGAGGGAKIQEPPLRIPAAQDMVFLVYSLPRFLGI